MNTRGWTLAFVLAVAMARGAAAQVLDWDALANVAAGTPIWVTTSKTEACLFEKTEGDTLYCGTIDNEVEGSVAAPQLLTFHRAEVRAVQLVPRRQFWKLDDSQGWLDFVVEVGGGAGVDARNQPDGFANFKVGRVITLNLNIDCVSGHCGFGVENAAMIPLVRYPQFIPNKKQNFARVYLEPGVGYRFGQGPFGAYTSAGALIMFWKGSTHTTPYIEYTHRFPFGSPWQGDNRIAVGIMFPSPRGSF